MKWSQALIKTLRETPADAKEISHQLMLRTNMIHPVSPGIYSILPLGYRVLENVERVIRDEMNAKGAQEVVMPSVVPKGLWSETGRWNRYGPNMMRVTDRKGAEHGLGPTHEEPVTDIARVYARSHRDLPLILYQITNKFRDEVRPRAGVMRGREFGMKDAYSFDRDEEGMKRSFNAMKDAYERIFTRLGLDFVSITADSGAIGGDRSLEFVAVTYGTGDVEFLSCNSCGYKANVERAEGRTTPSKGNSDLELRVIDTLDMKTVDDLVKGLSKIGHDIPANRMVKTIIYQTSDDRSVAAMAVGDDEINEVKLANALNCAEVSPAGHETVQELTKAPVGYAGPIGLDERVMLFIDKRAYESENVLFGVNQEHKHAIQGNIKRDIKRPYRVADIRTAREGDGCGGCASGTLKMQRGIEIGHVFQLGTVYSDPMNATFDAEDHTSKPFVMGCYGIGTTRLIATIIEQNKDSAGIIWPNEATPYHVVITPIKLSDERIVNAAEKLSSCFKVAVLEVLYDDRKLSPGEKFKDADLIGVPLRVTIGKNFISEGTYELRFRRTEEVAKFDGEERLTRAINVYYGRRNDWIK